MFDALIELVRDFTFSITKWCLDLLFGVVKDVLVPASTLDFGTHPIFKDLFNQLVIPSATLGLVLVIIFYVMRSILNPSEYPIGKVVKGSVIAAIITGSCYLILPFCYSKVSELSLVLVDGFSELVSNVTVVESDAYFRDADGNLIRYDEATNTYYLDNTMFEIREIAGKIVATDAEMTKIEKVINEDCSHDSKCTFEDYVQMLTDYEYKQTSTEISTIDRFLFESAVLCGNSGDPKVYEFINAFETAKANNMPFDYNLKDKCSGWFCKSTYIYNIELVPTAVVSLLMAGVILFIAAQMMFRSMAYNLYTLLLPFSAWTLPSGKKGKAFDMMVTDLLGFLVLNMIQMWIFLFSMVLAQIAISHRQSWLWQMAIMIVVMIFNLIMNVKIPALMGTNQQSLFQGLYSMMMVGQQITGIGMMAGGLVLGAGQALAGQVGKMIGGKSSSSAAVTSVDEEAGAEVGGGQEDSNESSVSNTPDNDTTALGSDVSASDGTGTGGDTPDSGSGSPENPDSPDVSFAPEVEAASINESDNPTIGNEPQMNSMDSDEVSFATENDDSYYFDDEVNGEELYNDDVNIDSEDEHDETN